MCRIFSQQGGHGLGWAVLLFSAALAFYRLRFGVNFDDEAFYAVLAQRFALGDRPYIDEANLRQTAALFTTPFYWLYLKLSHSTSGVIYALRGLFFFGPLLTAGVWHRTAKSYGWSRLYACLVAALVLSFVPFCVPAPSYNTLGCLFFAASIGLGLQAAQNDGLKYLRQRGGEALSALPKEGDLERSPLNDRTWQWAGAVQGCAALAYPPLLGPALVIWGRLAWLSRREGPGWQGPRWQRPAWRYFFGLLAVGLLFGLPLGPCVVKGLPLTLSYERMLTRPRTPGKLLEILDATAQLLPAGKWLLLVIAVLWLLAWRRPALSRLFVPLFLAGVLAWFWQPRGSTAALVPAICLGLEVALYGGLLGGLFTSLLPDRGLKQKLLWFGFFPSLCGGLLMALASDNIGNMNAGLGLFAALLTMTLALPALLPDRGLSPGLVALLGLGLFHLSFAANYQDGPSGELSSRIASGPYRGLWTRPEKAWRIADLCPQIASRIGAAGDRLLVYYDFPAAYLCAPVRPALPTSWSDKRAYYPLLSDYYYTRRDSVGITVVLTGPSVSPGWEALHEDPRRLLADHGWYRIYRQGAAPEGKQP